MHNNGLVIGYVDVRDRIPRKITGVFRPGPNYNAVRELFENAKRLAQEIDDTIANGDAASDVLWQQYCDALGKITAQVSLPDLTAELAEFSIDHLSVVEVFLFEPL